MHKVLNFALTVKNLSKNGARFSMDETIDYICVNGIDIKEVDTFKRSNGIFITAEKEGSAKCLP